LKIARLNIQNLFFWLYGLIIFALILFGTNFSKFHLIGPLYLHDLILIVVAILALSFPPYIFVSKSIFFLSLLSIAYFIISITNPTGVPSSITIRQYAIFGYMLLFGLIYSKFCRSIPLNKIVLLLFRIGLVSFMLQFVLTGINLANGINVFEGYNYYSPASVLGLIIIGAYILIYWRGLKRLIFFALVLALSATTGHSSAFLSVLVTLFALLFLRADNRGKVIMVGLQIVLISLLLFLPQFTDANAGFRTIAWGATMERVTISNYFVIGEGFGIPYFNQELIMELYEKVGTVGFWIEGKEYEAYLSSVHNSFLTIFIAVGFLPGLIVLKPLAKSIIYSFSTSKSLNVDFLVVALFGLSVWVSFNEILEVPHSAALYWFVYYAAVVGLSLHQLSANNAYAD